LSGLSFYEKAPQNYSWIDGDSGLNNYPTLYGVRILRDGSEIWSSSGNATTNDWTLEAFSFVGDSNFDVTSSTVFTIEFIGYCLIGNGGLVNAWDLDEISVSSSCGTAVVGGSLALAGGSTSTSQCVGLGTSTPVNVTLTGNQGPNNAYIITDENGNVLALPASPPFDFEGAGTGVCYIWNASYSGSLSGLAVGANVSDVTGCFDLSNSVRVDRFTASGGTITSPGGGTVCDSGSNLVDISLSGSAGSGSYIVTDPSGVILGLPTSTPIDISQYSGQSCLIWHIGYAGTINGLVVGGNASNITGTCYSLSNSIEVSKEVVNGGVISSNGVTYINICEGNGTSNVINATVAGALGNNSQIVIADAAGNIIDANPTFPYDFSGSASGNYLIYNVSWNNTINGLVNGGNINNLDGFCVGVSNALTIDKESANGGTISSPLGSNFDICIEGVISDPIDISLTGNVGSFGRWFITDTNNNIIGLPNNPPLQLDPTIGGTCIVRYLSFESSFRGLFIGQNISEFEGCYGVSNGITITKRSSSAGTINSGGFTYIDVCSAIGAQVVSVGLFNNFGNNQTFVVSDANGNIISVGGGPNFDFTSFALGEYRINHVAYHSGITGLVVGGNINSLSGDCVDVSNPMIINKYDPVGGTISTPGGEINVCGDGIDDMIDVSISGNQGSFSRWILTDANGNIIGLPGNPPFNFEGLNNGTCFLQHISYENGLGGLTLGGNSNSFMGCYALSNAITVNKLNISGGTLTTAGGANTMSICLQDNTPDIIDFTATGGNAANTAYIITDEQGNILDANASFPIDFSGAGAGVCRVYCVGYDSVNGLSAGANIANLTGCYALSTYVTVYRDVSQGGTITTAGGLTETSICVGDGNVDNINVTINGANNGNTNRWVITDADGNILGLPASQPFNLEGAGPGVCYIWNLNYSGSIAGLDVGGHTDNITGCFDLSNAIIVNRYSIDQSSSVSTLTYNMNACNAQNGSSGGTNYGELTGVADNSSSCTTLSGSNVYRNNPQVNFHSCTPGLNGTSAVCVSSADECGYVANSDKAVRFDVTIEPAANGTGTLSSISFYEAAPMNFVWINGTSGPNNYPTRYGIRVMKNGTEVFRQTGIATSFDWSLESFDFSSNPEFTVSETSTFSFELLGYCTAGVNSTISAWDLEDLVITSHCQGGLSGGNLTIAGGANAGGTSMEICADDGIDENITLNLLNAAGPNMAYVITDEAGNILALPSGQPFNFEGAGEGVCLIWNLAYTDGLIGAAVGQNAGNLAGCHSLSNPITITRKIGDDCSLPLVAGGTIYTSNGLVSESFCVNDGHSDVVDVQLVEQIGANSAWVITDANNVITAMPSAFPYDFEGTQIGNAYIYHISYEGDLVNMALGNSLDMIEGHYAFSNAIILDRTGCDDVSNEGYYYIKVVSGDNSYSRSFMKL